MMPPRTGRFTRWSLLFVAAGCARGNGADPAGTRSSGAPVAVATGAVSPSVTAPAGLTWAVGQRQAYRLELTSALAFGDQPNTFDFTVTGRLIIAPTAVNGKDASLFVILENAALESRVPDPEGQFRTVADQLSRFGSFIEVAGGHVIELRFAPDLPPMVVSIYRQIAATLQVTVPHGRREHFEAQERDGTGEYRAAYESTAERVWTKHKLAYSKLVGTSAGSVASSFQGLAPEVSESSGVIRLAEDGRLDRVTTKEQLKIRGAQVPVRSTTKVVLEASGVTRGAPVRDWRVLGEPLALLKADEPYIQASAQRAVQSSLDEARINGQSFETVVDNLRTIAVSREAAERADAAKGIPASKDKNAVVDPQETSQFVALSAMFRQSDANVVKAVKRVRADPAVAYTLIDALSSSGSPSAHKALAGMLTAKDLDPKVRARALGGLALTPRPSPIAVQALKEELARNPFSTSALFGLGSYAHYYGANADPAQEKAIGDLLVERFRHAEDMVPRLVVTLQAIANSGYQGAFEAVTRQLKDRRPEVRAAAMRALQRMPGPEIDPILASALTTDEATDVSVAALASARARKPSDVLVQALAKAAETAREPKVRYGSVALLADWKKDRADVREVIQRVAANDAEEAIRTLAQSAL